ncbi:MAG: hypothetical protein ACYCVE_16465 [Gemmatimonadaceae bacterium]
MRYRTRSDESLSRSRYMRAQSSPDRYQWCPRTGALLAAVALVAAIATACRTAGPQPGEHQPAATATLRVESHSFADRTIYVLVDGMRQRLGMAPGEATTDFVIPARYLAGALPLQFLADPVAENGPEISRKVNVYPGDTVVMEIIGPE